MMPTATIHQMPSIGERVIDVGRTWATAQYRIVTLAGQLDESNEWCLDANSSAHWIAEALDMCLSTAREWVRVSKVLRELPLIDAAFADHRLSYSKVRVLTRVATAENEAELLEIALLVPAGRLGAELATWLSRNERPEEREKRHRKGRSFRTWTDPEGMVCGFFRLEPAASAKPLAAIDALVMRTSHKPKSNDAHGAQDAGAGGSNDDWPSLAQQRADAFVELAEIAEDDDGALDIDTEIVVHVRGDGCTLDDGTPISLADVERIAPTSFIRALIHNAEGWPVNASGRQRHPTSRQKRVVKERDRCCVDCGSQDLLEYDHQPDFEQTKHTVVDELELRCGPCHRRRHRNAA